MSTDAKQPFIRSVPLSAMHTNEQRFRALLEKNRDALALFDRDLKIIYITSSVENLLGYTPDEYAQFEDCFNLLHPDDQQQSRALTMALLQTPGASLTWQHRIKHKDGMYRWIEVTMTNLLADPAVEAVLANFRNVTERKQAEERQHLLDKASSALVSSLDHQITLQEIAQLIVPSFADYCRIALLDEQQQIQDITVNHIDPEKIALVRSLYERYKDRTSTTHGLQKLLETGKPELISNVSQQWLATVQDDPEMLAILNALELKSYMGTPLHARDRIIGAITFSSIQPHRHYTPGDLAFAQELAHRITLVLENTRLYREAQEELAERKAAETRLQASEERFRALIEHNYSVILLSDTQGNYSYASPSIEPTLGYTPAEFTTINGFDIIHPEDIQSIANAFETLLATPGLSSTVELRAKHKNGSWRWFEATATNLLDEPGIQAIVTNFHDITERKEAEARKDEFISMASHELKTPVTSLKGFTNVLQRRLTKQGDEQGLHYLARMDVQVNKLTKLISDLLDVSKMQTGKLHFQEERFDLALLVREVVENLQIATQTHQLLIESRESVYISGDKDRIGQVLINLLTNAIKYSPHADKVMIRVSTDRHRATVSVHDFGIGIAQSHQQRIFERFYQVTDPEEKTYPGLGIGLYISQEIIMRHHGHIWVESKKGEGSTFSISLPIAKAAG